MTVMTYTTGNRDVAKAYAREGASVGEKRNCASRRKSRSKKNTLRQAVLEGAALTMIFYMALMVLGYDVAEMSQNAGALIWAGLSYGTWAMGL